MSRRWTFLIAVVVVVANGVAVAVDEAAGPLEWLFSTVVFLSALGGLHLAVGASRKAFAERSRDRQLAAVSPEALTQEAVAAERARLAADVQAVIRSAVLGMAQAADDAARAWDQDPLPALASVQAQGQTAVQELRRLLGLLRSACEPGRASATPTLRSGRTDVLLALTGALLAGVEHYVWVDPVSAGVTDDRLSLLLSCVAAATVGFCRRAPGLGAFLCGSLFALSALSQPIPVGFWFILTVGGLLWGVVRHGRVRDLVGAAALVAGVVVATLDFDPGNLQILLLIAGGAVTGAAAARAGDVWGRASRLRADDREAQLQAGVEEAVRDERLGVARELHDVVSNAVGLMTVQAGAAVAQMPLDRQRARAALDRVLATAADTVQKLDQLLSAVDRSPLGGGPAPSGRYEEEVRALVDRMRAAGLQVRLDVVSVPTGDTGAAVHRIVQEALTNALRYCPGSNVTVRVDVDPEAVVVEVDDDGPGPREQVRSGYGLVGIAERVHHLGGEVSTSAHVDGSGFAVHVRLPLAAGRTA